MIRPSRGAGPSSTSTRLSAMLLACAIAMVGFLSSSQMVRAGQTIEEFAEAFRVAYEARDTAALEKMLYLEGTPDMSQEFRKEAIILPEGEKLLSLEIVAAEPDDSKPEVLNGNTYVPNIKVSNRIDVRLGQDGGSYGRFFVVGETPAGEVAIGGITLAGEAKVWTAPADSPKPATPEAFVEAWKTAYNSGDGATIAKMYYLAGTPDDFAEFMVAFSEPWGSVTSVELTDHEDGPQPLNGNEYVPNLTDLRRVEYKGDQSSGKFAIGKTPEGHYAISGIRRAE